MKKQRFSKILLCAALAAAMLMPASAFAETGGTVTKAAPQFADMPDNWSTTALQNAVDNGLITGYEENGQKLIKPEGTLTRAEMGTIINKAFGAVDKADISQAKDVATGAWYADQMAMAVQMGSFAPSKELRPDDSITREEVATVLAKVFQLPEAKATALDSYSDKGSVSSWAKGYVGSMVENGYMSGNNGKLNPASNVTRAEFAAMMNNMVAQYISKADTYTTVAEKGNVMVNTGSVDLKDATVNGNLVLGDGVGDGNITLENVKVTGDLVARGGGVNSIVIKGDSKIGNVVVAKVNGNVRVAVEGNAAVTTIMVNDGKKDVIVEGTIDKLVVDGAAPVVAKNADIKTVEVNGAGAGLTVSKDAKIGTVTVAKEAEAAKVSVSGTVDTIKTDAPKTEIKAESGAKITNIEASKNAGGTNVAVAKDAAVDKLHTDAAITTSGDGKPATTTTTDNGTVNKQPDADKPSTGGGGGSGGGGGGGTTLTPSLKLIGTPIVGDGPVNTEVINGVVYYKIDNAWDQNTTLSAIVTGQNFDENKNYEMVVSVEKEPNGPAIAFRQSVLGKYMNVFEKELNNQNLMNKFPNGTLPGPSGGTPSVETPSTIQSLIDFFHQTAQEGEKYYVTIGINGQTTPLWDAHFLII